MTAYTTQTLVSNVVYSGTDAFVSNAVPAASYYAGQGSIQTMTYQLDGFVGLINIKATLNDQQESAPWFEIANIGNASSATTGTSSSTVIGNFSWIRAEISDYSAGNIGSITVAY
jgi:hypothetical protein